jgi:hypothetical protein
MDATMSELTNYEAIRPINMSRRKQRGWKRIAAVAAMLAAAASAKVAVDSQVCRPVIRFIQFYEQTEDLGVLNRVLLSVFMTTEPS